MRQHGTHILEDLKPEILATQSDSGRTVEVMAEEDSAGHYTAELTFPADGEWAVDSRRVWPSTADARADRAPGGRDLPG